MIECIIIVNEFAKRNINDTKILIPELSSNGLHYSFLSVSQPVGMLLSLIYCTILLTFI